MKKLLSVLLAVAMLLAVAIPAMAAATVTTPANDGLVTDGVVDFDDLLDTLEPSTPEVEDVTITSAPSTVTCEVEGQTVTVTHTAPCKVGYLSGDKYVAIAATNNGDGTYSFEAPEGVTDVVVVVKGDVNGDGNLTSSDYGRLNAYLLEKVTLDAMYEFAADATGEGSLTSSDYGRLNAVMLEKTTLAW